MSTSGFRFPGDGHRSFVTGMTGSGKTRAAVWQLSNRRIDKMPWIIVDFKHDELIGAIDHVEEISLTDKVPKHAGLYVVRPKPDEKPELQDFMWKIWAKEKTGVFIDEGYMVAEGRNAPALDALLTQGRSKKIPMIILAQRPAWLPKFVISESDFFQAFYLNVPADQERVRDFTSKEMLEDLPRFWSHWYDVAERRHFVLKPVPSDADLLQTFYDRLKPKRRAI